MRITFARVPASPYSSAMERTVYVVPHCHWDREWYQPHELFRWRLVQMIDELLDHLERHPEYACFNLDGQTIVIEDYLELRPENEGRLRALIEAGRIVIGPWLVQPDEFLPSGESHIRSCQRGIRYAERFGGGLKVGHCADQFGHIAQMPQIMAGLGLTSACLWRGVPDDVPGWSFHWQSPDGTRLPVLYLRNSYSSGWRLPHDVPDLLRRTQGEEGARGPDEPLLLMNGTDHSRMEKHIPDVLAAAAGNGYRFEMATLAGYERAMFEHGIDPYTWHGELRSPDRSNVLAGVLSARMPIKQADFALASTLERVAEPLELLSHLHGGPDGLPGLKHAWRLALENSPHDSICGCSVDQTHREMMPRYERAGQLAGQVAREALAHLAPKLEFGEEGGIAVFRPVPFAPVSFDCAVPVGWERYRSLELPSGERIAFNPPSGRTEVVLQHEHVSPLGALRHLDFLREQRYDAYAIERVDWSVSEGHLRIHTTVGDGLSGYDEEATRAAVRAAVESGDVSTAEVIVTKEILHVVGAVLPASNTIGVEAIRPSHEPPTRPPAVRAGKRWIENQFHRVELRKGRIRVTDLRTGVTVPAACRIVSEGDRGDEYNADILANAAVRIRRFTGAYTLDRTDRVSLVLAAELRVPAYFRQSRLRRSKWTTALPVDIWISLKDGIPSVDFSVSVDNTAKDHRLRALFRLPETTETVLTENQFHVAERPVEPPPWNGTSDELPPTTFPQKTFAAVESGTGGVAFFNRGLPEGEIVEDAKGRQWYALTLLRSVGWLSRRDLSTRAGHAGPQLSTPDAQEHGWHSFQFAMTTYEGTWRDANILPLAHAFAHETFALASPPTTGPARTLPLLTLDRPDVVPSALGRSEVDGTPVIRAWNASSAKTATALSVPATGRPVDATNLLEEGRERLAGNSHHWEAELRPWQIATWRLPLG
jgi:hypothetical protein